MQTSHILVCVLKHQQVRSSLYNVKIHQFGHDFSFIAKKSCPVCLCTVAPQYFFYICEIPVKLLHLWCLVFGVCRLFL